MKKINLLQKFGLFHDFWSPKIIAELNGQHVKIAKIQGEFSWHKHDMEDELFFVVKGQMIIETKDDIINLNEGEMTVIPRGILHKPSAKEECWIALFEPISTLNTGDQINDQTIQDLSRI